MGAAAATGACSAAGTGIIVTFTGNFGDLAALTAGVASLQGGAGTVVIAETTKGDKDTTDCSEHGICNLATGVCKCFGGFTSSDHNNAAGDYRDCGHMNQNPQSRVVVAAK